MPVDARSKDFIRSPPYFRGTLLRTPHDTQNMDDIKFQAGEFGHNDFYPVVMAACQQRGLDGEAASLGMILIDEIRGRLCEVRWLFSDSPVFCFYFVVTGVVT